MNTADSSEYSEMVEELSWMPRPDGSWMKQESAWAPVQGVLGVRRSDTEIDLHHEDTRDCWCRPVIFDEGKYVIVVHNYRECPDA